MTSINSSEGNQSNSMVVIKSRILVVDDDKELCELLKNFLQSRQFDCVMANSARSAKVMLNKYNFDAMVLDIQMPEMTGLELLKELRNHMQTLPIIMLTAMGQVENRVEGLALGADDYLAKPFEPEELVLRLKNIMQRKKSKTKDAIVQFGPAKFDMDKKKLVVNGEKVYLTSAEENLLYYLLKKTGKPVSREELSNARVVLGGERSIDVHIARIRKKIGDRDDKPQYLVTVRNKGYEIRLDG